MGAAIEIAGLRKTFRTVRHGARVAIDGFDLRVETGEVHGFLGPNGSGKTTTLRALLGLVRPDAGRMEVLGESAPDRLRLVSHRFGAIVESPRFFGNFTGRRTLHLLAMTGGLPSARVDEVLDLVGLRDRGDERVRAYSLGMKQRLAVASALLKRPELLILDEPANGLDPAGIREMRDMVRGLAADGVTVLVSSHLLTEIQQVCDHVTIISRGRRVTTGRVSEVLAGHDRGEYRVRVAEPDRAVDVLTGAGIPVTAADDHLVVSDVADPAELTRLLGGQDVWLSELTPLTPDLESVFLDLTGADRASGVPRQVDTVRHGGPQVIELGALTGEDGEVRS